MITGKIATKPVWCGASEKTAVLKLVLLALLVERIIFLTELFTAEPLSNMNCTFALAGGAGIIVLLPTEVVIVIRAKRLMVRVGLRFETVRKCPVTTFLNGAVTAGGPLTLAILDTNSSKFEVNIIVSELGFCLLFTLFGFRAKLFIGVANLGLRLLGLQTSC